MHRGVSLLLADRNMTSWYVSKAYSIALTNQDIGKFRIRIRSTASVLKKDIAGVGSS